MIPPDTDLGRMLDNSLHLAPSDALRVGTIAREDVLECAPDTPLCEAARLMSERGVSSILIVDDGVLLGIWTERDALAIDFDERASFSVPIRAVMSAPVRTVPASMNLHELTQRFRDEHLRHYLVIDEAGQRRGIVSQSDVVLNQGLEHYLRLRNVDSLVKAGLRTVAAHTGLAEVIRLMREAALDAVVVDFGAEALADARGRYGILTERDITRLLARQQTTRAVGELASRPLRTVNGQASLYRVRALLT